MIRIGISGVAGRMGNYLVQATHAHPGAALGAAIGRPAAAYLGTDVGNLAGLGPLGVLVTDSLHKTLDQIDVLIEFSNPATTLLHLEVCRNAAKPIVIGTTGFDPGHKRLIAEAALAIPLVFAPNMSIGVNALFAALRQVAKVLDNDYDVEIIEAHHRHKVDAPSGTALALGEAVAQARGQDLASVAVYERYGVTGPRTSGTIGFATVRGGDIVGDHTVMWAGPGERVEITHRAQIRFNLGAGGGARGLVAGR